MIESKGSARMRMKMTRMTITQKMMTQIKIKKALSNNQSRKTMLPVKLKNNSINQNRQLSRKQVMNTNWIGARNCLLKTPNSSNSQASDQSREAITHKGPKRPINETL